MSDETVQEAHERGYVEGRRRTLLNQLTQALHDLIGLGTPRDDLLQVAALTLERQETINKLREVCAAYGDNEWPDNLHLADVVEKHLARHLGD